MERLKVLREAFTASAGGLGGFETIAVAGSLGRLEAGPQSDIDCLLVARDGLSARQRHTESKRVMAILADSGLKLPKPGGIFRRSVTRSELLEPGALGSLEESPAVFGKRMQFLLDARALYRPAACRALQRDIVAWYGLGFIEHDSTRSWTALINDLSRYLHAYAIWQQFKFTPADDDSWLLRQAKFRSSRILTFAGLLFLLGASNERADKLEWLCAQLPATPLERLEMIMNCHDAAAFSRLLRAYEDVHSMLGDTAVRQALIGQGQAARPVSLSAAGREAQSVHSASAEIMTELSEFLLDRRDDWGRQFFVRVLF